MSYMGTVKPNSLAVVTLSAKASNDKPAILIAGTAPSSGTPASASTPVAAGGVAVLKVDTGSNGLLQVTADFNGDTDSGTLSVSVNGHQLDSADVSADTWWTYSVEPDPT